MLILRCLRWVERTFLVTIFSLMVILFFLNVVAREIGGDFASDMAWIEEAVRLMNLFLVFGALGLALERGRHVGIDTIRDKLPGKYRTSLLKLIDIVGFGFTCFLAYQSFGLVKFVFATGQTSPTLDIPMGYMYLAPLIGFSLLALRFILSFLGVINRFADKNNNQSEEVVA